MTKLFKVIVALLAVLYAVEAKFYPDNFDVRSNWFNCTYNVFEEGACVGNWAIATMSTISDRSCIQGVKYQAYSPQNLIDCYNVSYSSCADFENLSRVTGALDWLKTNPVTDSTCYPYTSDVTGEPGTCKSYCSNYAPVKTKYTISGYQQLSNPDTIKDSLLNEGSVLVIMQIYSDFLLYTSGLYVRNSNEYLQLHALKLVGWGTSKDASKSQYWIMQNSWSTSWGSNGLIQISFNTTDVLAFYSIKL